MKERRKRDRDGDRQTHREKKRGKEKMNERELDFACYRHHPIRFRVLCIAWVDLQVRWS